MAKVNWSASPLTFARKRRDFYSTHTAELEKTHPQWKANAMDAGVQGFISKRYVPRGSSNASKCWAAQAAACHHAGHE